MASTTSKSNLWERSLIAGTIIYFVMLFACLTVEPAPPLTTVHREAVSMHLNTQGLNTPARLELDPSGFVVADFELREGDLDPPIPLSTFATARLMAIREALLPHGYVDYRVNLTVSTKATREGWLGSARFLGRTGQLEWIDASGTNEIR
jgi:hypothetical protein